MAKRKKRNYINNPEFLEALKVYRNECLEAEKKCLPTPVISDYIGKCITKIATNLAKKGNFSGYTYKDDMIGDAIENCVQVVKNFNPDLSSNPFAYFTKISWYAFLRRIEKEKKNTYINYKVTEMRMTDGTIIDKDVGISGEAGYVDLNNEYMTNFVESYEERLLKKKEAVAKAKLEREREVESVE